MTSEFESKKYLALVLFIFSLVLLLSIILLEELLFKYEVKQVVFDNAYKKTFEREKVIQSFLEQQKDHLHSLKESIFFKRYINETISKKDDLENLFLLYAKANSSFMQIRFIDAKGNEKIRVDRKQFGETPFLISDENLQNKSHREYFSKSKHKQQGQVWFSAIDLNIENNKIQIPYRPTLRAVVAIENKDGFGGILVINYFMEDFLKKLTLTPLYDMTLCDDKGFTIFHYDHNKKVPKSWGNSLDHKYNISKDFPKEYENILSKGLLRTENFVCKDLDIKIDGGLKIILQLNNKYVKDQATKQKQQYLLISLLIFILSLILILIILKHLSKKLLNLEELAKANYKLEKFNEKLEEEVSSRTKELKESNLKWEFAIEGNGDGLWDWNLQTNEVFFSKQWKKMLGFEDDEIQGSLQEWEKRVHPDDLKNVYDDIQEHLENKTPNYESKHRVLCKNGLYKWILDRGVILERDAQNKPLRMIGTHKDISNEVKQENEINNLYEELKTINTHLEEEVEKKTNENFKQFQFIQNQSKLAAMGEMIGAIAHQWRQPLHELSIRVQKLKFFYSRDRVNQEFINDFIEKNMKNIQFMSQTIDDFRSFFKINKHKTVFSSNKAIQQVYEMTQGQFKEHDIEVVIKNNKELKIRGFEGEFKQVILNLFINAKDVFLEKNIDQKKITVVIDDIITVEDNAGGIDEEILPRIFEPYFTTKEEGKGTGMGLYLSKMIIVDNMNGDLSVSNTSEGALFRIRI